MTSNVRPGDVLAGKYRVERVLGQGGMGYVVAARHLQLDQLVAMKFLRRGALDESEATGRFVREAKAAVKLKNEHIAKVYDVGALDSGEPYMVMEYLDGLDLAQMAKQRGRLPVAEACEYLMQACEALAEAHSFGFVHRDIKLANIFVTKGPAGGPLVKVLDFGISKTNPFGEQDHDMTRTTSMLGSPRFMSPEQMRDPRNVDARSDIWSLGVVLYRLCAGTPPFEADTLGRLLTMVMHEHPPPIAHVAPDLPPGFDGVVMRCLAKDPAQRFSNVAELAYAIAPYTADAIRGRASADRIAAMLSVVAMPRSGDFPIANAAIPSARQSSPPQHHETGGTAAPWAGTHGGTTRAPAASRSALVWAAVAVAALLVIVGLLAKARHDRYLAETSAGGPSQATVAAGAPALPTTADAPLDVPPATSSPLAAPAVAVGTPLPPTTTSPATARADDKAKRAPVVTATPARKPAKPATGHDDGIPSTRD